MKLVNVTCDIKVYTIKLHTITKDVPCTNTKHLKYGCPICGGKGHHKTTRGIWKVRTLSEVIRNIDRDKDGNLRYWTSEHDYYPESSYQNFEYPHIHEKVEYPGGIHFVHFDEESAERECERLNKILDTYYEGLDDTNNTVLSYVPVNKRESSLADKYDKNISCFDKYRPRWHDKVSSDFLSIKLNEKYWLSAVLFEKPYEIRKMDRPYKVGSVIELIRVSESDIYPTTSIFRKITSILTSDDFEAIQDGYCVLGLSDNFDDIKNIMEEK